MLVLVVVVAVDGRTDGRTDGQVSDQPERLCAGSDNVSAW